MSNYRRLISYIYAYEGGTKGKNVGYAKLEARSGQCKIQVNVKNIYIGSRDIGVYLLTPGSEIFIGKMFVRSGKGDFRAAVSASDIEGSGIGLEQCYGLTVHELESAWLAYTTIWEDAVAHAAEVELAEVTSEQRRNREMQQGDADVGTAVQEMTGRISVSEEIELDLQREEQKPPWRQPQENQEPQRPELMIPDIAAQEPETEGGQDAVPEPPVQEPEKELDIIGQREEAVPAPAQEKTAPAAEPGNPELLRKLELQEQEAEERGDLWRRMRKRYTKLLAFDYDNGCEILSIRPQDIGLMPREIWVYGNNSFLLHGYYNYRHLIVARLENPKGAPRYLLGVPGHYFSNEKYMASMFGFPHFVLAKKQPQEDGRFGYWYTDIRLS